MSKENFCVACGGYLIDKWSKCYVCQQGYHDDHCKMSTHHSQLCKKMASGQSPISPTIWNPAKASLSTWRYVVPGNIPKDSRLRLRKEQSCDNESLISWISVIVPDSPICDTFATGHNTLWKGYGALDIVSLTNVQMEKLYKRNMLTTILAMEQSIKDYGFPKMMVWSKTDINRVVGKGLGSIGDIRMAPVARQSQDVTATPETRWLPHGLMAHDVGCSDRVGRRGRRTLLEFDRWWSQWSRHGYANRPNINESYMALIQHLRPVQHFIDRQTDARRVWDLDSNDINIRTYKVTIPDWKREPLWPSSKNNWPKCAQGCEQQGCTNARNCTEGCCFHQHHTIPHLCNMHWRILIYEEDSECDSEIPSPRLDIFSRCPWVEDF